MYPPWVLQEGPGARVGLRSLGHSPTPALTLSALLFPTGISSLPPLLARVINAAQVGN